MFKTIVKPTFILTMVAFIAAFTLVNVNNITKDAIKQNKIAKEKSAIAIILPGFEIGNEQSVESFRYWVGEKKNSERPGDIQKAYAFVTSSPGYSGAVESMVGVDSEGKILGIYIITQTETPGLGARCVEVVNPYFIWDMPDIFSGKIDTSEVDNEMPWFQRQFTGLNIKSDIRIVKEGDWTEEKGAKLLEQNAITSITGATITGRAVITGIKNGYASLQKILAETEGN